jgi:aminoglycoside/choline kinase family phosphotransferase
MLPDLSKEIHQFLREFVKTEYTVIPLAGDASTRKYFRVISSDRSWVLMSWEPFTNPDTYPFLDVQKHFAKHGVRVPSVEKVGPELGVVLLEDLGDLTLERKFWENQNQEQALSYYQQTIDELIKIHFLASKPQKDPSICQLTEFDTAKFMWEMNYAREHLLEKLAGIKLLPATATKLQSVFTDICERLHAEPKYVCHRDYHSRNVMLKLGQVCVIDFQDARRGPIQYDLVSLVHDSYVAMSPASKEFVIKDYLNKAKSHLPKTWSRGQFDEIFDIQTIQRCLKACGSFSSFYNARKDLRYLKYIHPTINLVANTLANHPKYAELLNVIRGEGLLEKNFDILCAG